MNGFSNIEFINFETLNNNENDNFTIKDPNYDPLNYLNNFLLERLESECDSQTDSIMNDSQSVHSYFSEAQVNRVSESFSGFHIDKATSENESFDSGVQNNSVNMESLFSCSFDNCKKNFRFKWILDRHCVSHKVSKTYCCFYKGCPKAYKSKENLNLHVKNIHLKEKPYSCRFCQSVFSHRNGIFAFKFINNCRKDIP